MDTIDRYIFFEFLKYFIGALLLLVGVALIAKVLNTVDDISNYKGPFKFVVLYYIYQTPFFITIVIGPALLFAVSFTVGMYNESMEIPVILAAGRSFVRTVAPIIAFSAVISVSLFFFNEFLTFPWLHESFEIKHRFRNIGGVSREQFGFWSGRTNFEVRAGNRYYHIGAYDLAGFNFNHLQVVELFPRSIEHL